jgi:hypothetical protein
MRRSLTPAFNFTAYGGRAPGIPSRASQRKKPPMSKFVKVSENKYINSAHIVQMKVDGDPSSQPEDLEKLRVTLFVDGGADVKLRGKSALHVYEQLAAN